MAKSLVALKQEHEVSFDEKPELSMRAVDRFIEKSTQVRKDQQFKEEEKNLVVGSGIYLLIL
jgi:hypothetical protein